MPTSPPVPAGTWADESEEKTREVERLIKPAGVAEWRGGEVVAFPLGPEARRRLEASPERSPAPERTSTAPDDTSGTQRRHAPTETGAPPTEPTRPKYLATELLARDWTPAHPLRRTKRILAVAAGAGGAIGAPVLAGLEGEALGVAVLFALCAAAGLAPLSPSLRGLALVLIGGAGAGLVLGLAAGAGAGLLALEAGFVGWTAAALFFRAAHNRSRVARALVGAGLAGLAAWLVLTGGIDACVVGALEWQAWVGPASRIVLFVLGLLTLLTFLDPSGSGGAWVAGYAVLAWLVLQTAGELVVGWFPAGPSLAAEPAGGPLRAALPLFVALVSVGACQVCVTLTRRFAPDRATVS
ncbi:MAG: hypothetical protein KF729_03770 [Sandaracinaceae bacterium]|nr:hypothetical protein [Sandaracinaceae bacterium]